MEAPEMRFLILQLTLLLAWQTAGAQETIVFTGYPTTTVQSGTDYTTHVDLNGAKSSEYRVLIIARGGKYYWASRENKELMYFQHGITHWFISKTSGYIKIIDPSLIPGNEEGVGQYVYMEHLTILLDTITYWGTGSELAP